MTITVRDPFRLLLVALGVFCAAPQLLGVERTTFPDPALNAYSQNADAQQKETVFRIESTARLGVIIEFHAAPLLQARKTEDVRLASATLEALTAQLAEDLARIEGDVPDRIATQASGGGAIRHTYRMTFAGASATVDRSSLAAIRALPYVRAVHEDRRVEAYLARSVPHIGVPEVRQQYGRRGRGIVVAIIDTGIDYRHWALGEGFGPGFKVIGGYDFHNGDADPLDDHGHGTHVAGIVAANHKYLTGVAPDATLLAYKVLGDDGGGNTSVVLAGIERAIDPNDDGDPSDHADVVNMSLGGPASPDDPVIAAVERGAAAGVVFCVAAGNSGAVGGLGSPAMAPSAITVAASDLQDNVAAFSTGGPVGGRWSLKPEVAAPGVDIVSSALDGKLVKASGTSMAAPHVSGVAALLLEEHPGWTLAEIRAAIVSTAKPIAGREKESGRFIAYAGSGRIDALHAIGATILPAHPAASFGLVRNTDPAWTSSTTITLTNKGGSAETLTLKQPTLPPHTKLTVVPESVTLGAGESVELKLTLEVTTGAVANDADILLAGILELTGARSSVQLPWTSVKADVLRVTFTGNDDFLMYLSNGAKQAAMWPEGPRTYAAIVPYMLTSDIMILIPATEDRDARLIIRERQVVEGYTDVTVSPDEAAYEVRIDAVDERGLPLNQLLPGISGRLWHRFELPSGNLIELAHEVGRRSLRISNFRWTLFRTYETWTRGTDRYFAAYRHLRDVKQDEVLAIRSSDWASQKIGALCRKPECTVSVGAGLGSPLLFTYHPLAPGSTEFTLHLTPAFDPRYDFRAYAIVREKGFNFGDRSTNPWTFISNSLRNVEGRFSTSPFGRVSGAEYFPPDRETPLVLGDGPTILRTAVGEWFVSVEPFGSAGELFGSDDARDVDVNIERLDGSVSIHPYHQSLYGMRPTPGIYRLTVTDEYRVAGRVGHVTQVSNYDTHAAPDAPPSLSSLRIEDGRGVATTTVRAGSRSRVVFGARQSLMSGQGSWMVKHSRLDAAATQAWWRPHGTTEWLPLTVTNTGEDYEYRSQFPGSPGTLYAASLHPATAVEGEVDLRFSLMNLTGGTTEVVYEPAFVVGPAGTRRRVMR